MILKTTTLSWPMDGKPYRDAHTDAGECLVLGLASFTEQVRGNRTVSQIVGESPAMRRVLELVKKVTNHQVSVILTGETGTGKSLLAQLMHLDGPRKERPFISQNCAALPETLCESELFGYKRGAFSGAVQDKHGLFEVADGGTIFLDEVSELSLAAQAKLQVLQDGVLRRLGDTRSRQVDVRVIAATNKDLVSEVEQGNFRQDLYYRLNVVSIHMPSLRERREDIPLLAAYFLNKHRDRISPGTTGFSNEALGLLCHYDFPGNVRELENLIQRALVFGSGPRIEVGEWLPIRHDDCHYPRGLRLEELERKEILDTIKLHGGKLNGAAKDLGISRTTLWRRMKDYRILSPSVEQATVNHN